MITATTLITLIMMSDPLYAHLDKNEVYCMASNIWHEARAEDIEGQFAVAHATLERVKDKRYPSTICGVVLASVPDPKNPSLPKKYNCAFSWNCDRKSDKIHLYNKNGLPNRSAVKTFTTTVVVSLMAITGEIGDFCNGANYYYNPKLANPSWSNYYTETCVLGNHRFLRRERRSKL